MSFLNPTLPLNIIAKSKPPINKLPKAIVNEIFHMKKNPKCVPMVINGKEIVLNNSIGTCPYNQNIMTCLYTKADENSLKYAIDSMNEGKKIWNSINLNNKMKIFKRASRLVQGKYYNKLIASTILEQGKNIYQAEIDAICELGDFLNFNIYYRTFLENSSVAVPSTKSYKNSLKWQPLHGFVAAITPFNFTAIGGNLASAPLFMGNSVIWKPSDHSILSNYYVYKLLIEAGIPPECLAFVPCDPKLFTEYVLKSENLGGLAFTGSDKVFESVTKSIYGNIENYKSFPRIVGETGGYNYHFVLPDMKNYKDLDTIVDKTILGAFEYSGQKCSATKKLIVPEKHYEYFVERISNKMSKLQVGCPEVDNTFCSSVISLDSYNKAHKFLEQNRYSILSGGKTNKKSGYYIYPTLIEDKDHELEKKYGEIFAPILAISSYKENDVMEEIKRLHENRYALTSSIFTRKQKYFNMFNELCGNLYINDKSTGSIVGQQIFGGFKKSGTNDKAGSEYLLHRFGNIQTIKYNIEL